MKKCLLFLSVTVAIFFISCGSYSGDSEPVKQDTGEVVSPPIPPISIPTERPSEVTVTPIEFGLTEIHIEKNEEGDCGSKGNISVYFEIFFTDSISSSPSKIIVEGYDCGKSGGEGTTDGKEKKEMYDDLLKTKAQDLSVTYVYGDGSWHPHRLVIKGKRIPGKDGLPSKVIPEKVIR